MSGVDLTTEERWEDPVPETVLDRALFCCRRRRYKSFNRLTARNRAATADSAQASKSMVPSSLPARVSNDD
jgi:hypothetical protein